MKTAIRLLAMSLLLALLAACKTTPEAPEVDTSGGDTDVRDETPTQPEVQVHVPDPRDATDVCNIANSNGPLGRRVVYFDFDQSTIRSEFREQIEFAGRYLAAHSGAEVTLEGHADERGTREYNLGLGERRGNAVNGLLSAHGARGNQIRVVSYGEEQPRCRESSESCWSQNRRVELVYTDLGAASDHCQ